MGILETRFFNVSGGLRSAVRAVRGLPGEIVLLTIHDEEAMFMLAMSLGVRGYVVKERAPRISSTTAILPARNMDEIGAIRCVLIERRRRLVAKWSRSASIIVLQRRSRGASCSFENLNRAKLTDYALVSG